MSLKRTVSIGIFGPSMDWCELSSKHHKTPRKVARDSQTGGYGYREGVHLHRCADAALAVAPGSHRVSMSLSRFMFVVAPRYYCRALLPSSRFIVVVTFCFVFRCHHRRASLSSSCFVVVAFQCRRRRNSMSSPTQFIAIFALCCHRRVALLSPRFIFVVALCCHRRASLLSVAFQCR